MNEEERRRIHDAMVRLSDGDRTAFDAVFRGLWEPLREYVRRALNNHSEAEDLAQQTLLKVFSRISEFDTSRDGVSWAFGIATYEILTVRKKVQRRRETPIGDIDRLDGRPSQEEALVDTELHEALAAVIGQLQQSDREILLAPAGNSGDGVSPAAWRKRRQRALERLRTLWGSRHD